MVPLETTLETFVAAAVLVSRRPSGPASKMFQVSSGNQTI
jgi:hypothetical protein